MKRIILLALVVLLLTSCAPDPRKQAEADATRLEAESKAASEEQARQHAQEVHDADMADRKATQAEWQTTKQNLIRVVGAFAQITVALFLLGVGVSGVWMMFATSKAYAKYADIRAEVLANQIPLNPVTFQYPLIQYKGKGLITATNPNDGSVVVMDTRNEADRQKVKAAANVQFAGVLSRNARMSDHPGEVASIPATQVIDGE
jgi:hypothetical protein